MNASLNATQAELKKQFREKGHLSNLLASIHIAQLAKEVMYLYDDLLATEMGGLPSIAITRRDIREIINHIIQRRGERKQYDPKNDDQIIMLERVLASL